ncbi:hypothetical protein, variant [Exophiala mesophila]|uniref:Uncharacterized protein n=1 Tax=Exophiala mesophila TaxID=212818 RepID=A0A0D1Z4Q8_EXOME|nr:uncharacterized protein PV10_07163 [Exophiala mesophila]XP_016221361.1 hypothetical protein, variant [Exophiala mesophila]KIV89786.1 hypothetical protein PV10_07163 [Exophiala mesophila]KIV89787.1 hypothetical protein, variant [Exophiala mesophila]
MSHAILDLTQPLKALVSSKFSKAYEAKDIVFSSTSLAILAPKEELSFQLRYCPALAKKPQKQDPPSQASKKGSKFDPFDNPASELLIAAVPSRAATHTLVLNKFPVIKRHFIIATREYKPQTGVLEMDDLSLTHACLRAWGQDSHTPADQGLFAFFNSGEHSGASQPHRHLQFLPVRDMVEQEQADFRLLVHRMTVPAHPNLPLYQDPAFPILHFSTPLERDISPEDLHAKYVLLLKAALSASRSPGQPFNDQISVESEGSTVFSYNLALTTDRMAICPRKQEAFQIPFAGPDSSVALNGTILAGTLMVKEKAEWDALRTDPSILDRLVAEVGYPMSSW